MKWLAPIEDGALDVGREECEPEDVAVVGRAGAEVTLASPRGRQPPLDPKSNQPEFQTDATHRFEKDEVAKA